MNPLISNCLLQDIEINIYTLDQELQKLKVAIKHLTDKQIEIMKMNEEFTMKLLYLQEELAEQGKLLSQKCEKRKCRKMYRKLNKLDKRLSEKHVFVKEKLEKLENNKCEVEKCREFEASIISLFASVETLNKTQQSWPAGPQPGCQNLSQFITLVNEMNNTFCTKEQCRDTSDMMNLLKVELEQTKANATYLNETKCSRSSCMEMSKELGNFGKITDALYNSQEEILSTIQEIKKTTCSKEECQDNQAAQEDILSSIQEIKMTTCSKNTCQDINDRLQTKCDQEVCDDLKIKMEQKCGKDYCENTAIGLDNIENVVDSLYNDINLLKLNSCKQATCDSLDLSVDNINNCMEDPGSAVCLRNYHQGSSIPNLLSLHSTCFNDPENANCIKKFPSMTSLMSVVKNKCDQEMCSSLEACLIDPRGDTCTDTFGSAVAPYGLVSALPELQNWVETIKEGAVLNCWMTQDILPSKSPTDGSESWLVTFDQCETLGRQGVIESLYDNKFFQISIPGKYHET